jgi:hypothetical protein
MKAKIKIIMILINVLIIVIAILFNINLMLNKKYCVDEISSTKSQQGLIGIQEIITKDYIYMIYFSALYSVILIILCILYIKKK